MLHDHIITKPESIGAYASHQLVEEMLDGSRPPFVDLGDYLIVRGPEHLTPHGKPLPEIVEGGVYGFELVASCGTKTKGRHTYFPVADWRARRAWLERRAHDAGFELRAVSIRARSEKIERRGKTVRIDRTEFAGILQVTNADALKASLADGLPGPARAFGRGMIRI